MERAQPRAARESAEVGPHAPEHAQQVHAPHARTAVLRIVAGLILITVEPVAAVRLLGMALHPKDAIGPRQREELKVAVANVDKKKIDARAKVLEAEVKAADAKLEVAEAEREADKYRVRGGTEASVYAEVKATKAALSHQFLQETCRQLPSGSCGH